MSIFFSSDKINARRFVRFSKSDFEAALGYVPGRFHEVDLKGTWEYVYDVPILKVQGIAIRIYSSIDKITGLSRDKGADAIRLVLLRTDNQMMLSESEKLLRTTGWEERLTVKAKDLIKVALNLVCPRCKIILVKRSGKHGVFLGCPNYPDCTHTHSLKEEL